MPDLTPEQEQERLRLLQQQNEAANELFSTYEKLSSSAEKLKNSEKELVSLSNQLIQSSSKINESLQKRSEALTSIVNLSKVLNKETLNYNKSLIESAKLKDKQPTPTPIKQPVKTPQLTETTTQTIKPNINVEVPELTVTPKLKLADIPELTIIPNLQLAPQNEPLFVTPNLKVKPILDPLFVTPNLKLVPPTEPLEVTPNIQLATLSPLTVTPEIQVEMPALTVTPEVNVVNPTVTTAGLTSTTSSFPFDKKQLTEITKEGIEQAFRKYERSPSLGVTLDKDKSGLFDKLITAVKGITGGISPAPLTNITPQLTLSPSPPPVQGRGPVVQPSVTPSTNPTTGLIGSLINSINSLINKLKSPTQTTSTPSGGGGGTPSNNTQTTTPLNNGAPLSQQLLALITATTDEAKKLQEEIIRINEKIKAAGGAGFDLKKAFKDTNNEENLLKTLLGQVERSLDGLTNNADYLYRTFQDIIDNLRNQNTLLKQGKEAFNDYTDIAQDLNSYQKGYKELTDTQFKKYQQNIELQKDELRYIQQKLPASIKAKEIQVAQLESLKEQGIATALQLRLLKSISSELAKEEELFVNTTQALDVGIPLLEKELNLTKQISDGREKLGGITKASSKALQDFGGSLAKYLNISDATDAVTEYNKNVIKGALESESVKKQLLDIEARRAQAYKDHAGDEKKLNEELTKLELEHYATKQAAIDGVTKGMAGFINKFKSLKVFTQEAAVGLTKVFSDPVILLTTLIELGFKADRQVTELGKSMGVSKDVANDMRADMAEFAALSGDAFLTMDRLAAAQAGLSKELGMSVKFSNEELATFAKLTELSGLNNKEAARFSVLAAQTGVSTEKYTNDLRVAAFSSMQATKTHFDTREMLKDISNLSAGIAIKFQGNPKALADAYAEAKKLGSSLEQIDKIGDSILNWESSVENELKAELMTGKQLNLERARAAALSGNQLELTREIASQVGTSAEFNKMNVLAQKSLAEAFGLSRDEMADMLMKQEAVNTYGAEAAKLNKDQLEDMKKQGLSASEYLQKQEQQQAAQDKFKNAIIKIQGIIGNLVDGPVGQLLDALANMVTFATKLLVPIGYLIKPFSVVGGLLAKMVDSVPGLIIGFSILSLVLLPKIAAGLGSIGRSILGLGKGIRKAFSSEGIKGFFSKVKSGFSGVKPPKSQFAGGSFSKGKELVAKKQAADAAAANADKTSTTAKGGGDNAKGFAERMKNIAKGIKYFADVKVLLGALNLIPASIGLVAFIPGALGAKIIQTIDGGKLKESLKGIAGGIKTFADTKVLLGSFAMILASAGLVAMIPGALAAAIIGAVGPLAKKGLSALASGVKEFGDTSVMKGALGIALLGASLIPAAFAFQMFADVKWEDMAKAGVALIGLGVAGAILGSTLPLMLMGAVAIAALGASLIPLALSINLMAKGLPALSQLFTSIQNVDVSKLLSIGPALIMVGAGLAALGGGGVMAAIGSFLGGDPIKKIERLAKAGDGLMKTANGLQGVASALTQLSTSLASLDIAKLEKALEVNNKRNSITNLQNPLIGISKIGSFFSETKEPSLSPSKPPITTTPITTETTTVTGTKTESIRSNTDLTPMIAAIKEVKTSVDTLYAKDQSIYMDGKEVGTTLVKTSYKLA